MSLIKIMFFKALVVALVGAIAARWAEYKQRRGLALRLDRKRNVWVLDDRIERFERYAKIALCIALAILIPCIVWLCYLFVTGR